MKIMYYLCSIVLRNTPISDMVGAKILNSGSTLFGTSKPSFPSPLLGYRSWRFFLLPPFLNSVFKSSYTQKSGRPQTKGGGWSTKARK